jgi:hypothetical protein
MLQSFEEIEEKKSYFEMIMGPKKRKEKEVVCWSNDILLRLLPNI